MLISCRSLPEKNCLSPTRRSRHSAPPGIPPVTWNVSAFHLTTPCLNSSRKLFPKRVLSTTWRAAQKGDARDSARLSCHVLSPGAQRGRCLAGGCHARLRVSRPGLDMGGLDQGDLYILSVEVADLILSVSSSSSPQQQYTAGQDRKQSSLVGLRATFPFVRSLAFQSIDRHLLLSLERRVNHLSSTHRSKATYNPPSPKTNRNHALPHHQNAHHPRPPRHNLPSSPRLPAFIRRHRTSLVCGRIRCKS